MSYLKHEARLAWNKSKDCFMGAFPFTLKYFLSASHLKRSGTYIYLFPQHREIISSVIHCPYMFCTNRSKDSFSEQC